jgi:hypothetical protein
MSTFFWTHQRDLSAHLRSMSITDVNLGRRPQPVQQPWYNPNAPLPDTDPCANAWRFVFVESFYRRNESSAASSLLRWNVEASNLSAVVCALSYSIQPLNVTINVNEVNNPAQIITAEPATRATKLLDGLSISGFNSLLGSEFAIVTNQIPPLSYYTSQMRILSLQNSNSSMDAFLDPETLRDTASSALEGVGVQSANIYLRSPQQQILDL